MSKINELSEKQDRELVGLLIGGSQAAFGELYARYRELLIYLCRQSMKNDADAKDIVHDVFLKLWETRHFLNPELSFSGFIKTMAVNHTKNKLKHVDVHSRFARNILINKIDSTNETEDTIINNDYAKLLDKLKESLPTRQKEIFRLSRIEGLTYKEISELLHISDANVRNQVSIALKKIKEYLKQHSDIHIKTVIIFLTFFL